MNHMAKVSEMLGVELDEEFEIEKHLYAKFKITEAGLEIKPNNDKTWHIEVDILLDLLTGEATIKRKPWTPKMEETYYCWLNYGSDWNVGYYSMTGYTFDLNNIAMGNCFRTRDDAKAHKDEVIARYEEIRKAVSKNA